MRRAGWLSGLVVVLVSLSVLLAACSLQRQTEPRWLVLVTTSQLQDSGLLDALVSAYEQATGVHVKRLPIETTRGLEYAGLAGVDVLLLPAGSSLDKLAGPGPTPRPYQSEPFPTPTPLVSPAPIPAPQSDLLYNERQLAFWSSLVILAPASDPLNIKSRADAASALKIIALANGRCYGISQESEPGLYQAETRIWNLTSRADPKFRGSGYQIIPGNLPNLVRQAAHDGAYAVVPLDTYLSLQNDPAVKGRLQIGFQNDNALFMPYEVAVPNNTPTQAQDRDIGLARSFVAFLTSQSGQQIINRFTKEGAPQPLYRPTYYPVYQPPL